MKKWLLLSSFLFFIFQAGYAQVTFVIELTADGQSIGTDEDALFNKDVEWTVTDLNTGCVIDHVEAYDKFTIIAGGVDLGGISVIMVDMNIFDDCAAAVKGHVLVFDMKIVTPTNRFYGYTAKKSFVVLGGSVDEVLTGENAINFTSPVGKID